MFDIRKYRQAATAAEAVRLLAEDPAARCLAGGTDVLVRLRELHSGYDNLVDIHNMAELKPILRLDDGTIRIGAGATFTDVMESPVVRECAPLLAEAAASVAGPQIRNVGTIGGNLCNGAVSADTAAPVLALNARLRLLGPGGERWLPAKGFHTGPGKVALLPGEVLLSVDIPADDWRGWGGQYVKYAMREAMDIATIGCAAAVRLREGRMEDVRLAFAVAAPTPIRCPAAEAAAKGQIPGEAAFRNVREAVAEDVKPRTSWRATAEFRLHIIRTLAGRVLAEAARRAEGARA